VVPGLGPIAAGGLPNLFSCPPCLAQDGRSATTVTGTNGNDALICIDDFGPHVVAQAGDPAPDGSTFNGFCGPCTFTDDGAIIFAG
jgi:hypothetical protein